MKYKKILDKLHPFLDGSCEGDVSHRLALAFEELKKSLEKIFSKSESNEDFKRNCDKILKTISLFETGERNEACNFLFESFFSEENAKHLKICKINAGTPFYRMRSADEYRDLPKDEMYHIPFEKRHLVGNYRYSQTGLPIFYTSASVYGCWEECKRCNLDFSNIALFKSESDLLFLDMVCPDENRSIHEDELFTLPLIISSIMKVAHPDGKFVPEYIIPQFVMECFVKFRREHPEKNLIGIRYESIHNNEQDLLYTKFHRKDLFFNFAVPPFETKPSGHCEKIKNLLQIWDTTSWAKIQYKSPAIVINSAEENDYYKASRFGILESSLGRIAPGTLTYSVRTKNGIPPGAIAF